MDYVVFRGMKEQGAVKEIILLDGDTRAQDRIRLQKSIEKVIEMGNYEWLIRGAKLSRPGSAKMKAPGWARNMVQIQKRAFIGESSLRMFVFRLPVEK